MQALSSLVKYFYIYAPTQISQDKCSPEYPDSQMPLVNAKQSVALSRRVYREWKAEVALFPLPVVGEHQYYFCTKTSTYRQLAIVLKILQYGRHQPLDLFTTGTLSIG